MQLPSFLDNCKIITAHLIFIHGFCHIDDTHTDETLSFVDKNGRILDTEDTCVGHICRHAKGD